MLFLLRIQRVYCSITLWYKCDFDINFHWIISNNFHPARSILQRPYYCISHHHQIWIIIFRIQRNCQIWKLLRNRRAQTGQTKTNKRLYSKWIPLYLPIFLLCRIRMTLYLNLITRNKVYTSQIYAFVFFIYANIRLGILNEPKRKTKLRERLFCTMATIYCTMYTLPSASER